MNRTFLPAGAPLHGTVRVPGDKSISHRAVLFAAMAEGESRLAGVLDSADVRSTIRAVTALGAQVSFESDSDAGLCLWITGWGTAGPSEPEGPIDCGNSGTTCRLLMGVLAGWPISVTFDGDDSLRRRPMRRVTAPLESMGARITTTGGCLPVTMRGGELTGIDFKSPVPSAQVKTAILLAGLRAAGKTTVTEPVLSRNHTELLLPAFGVPVARDHRAVSCSVIGPSPLTAVDVDVPGDPSSAAFLAGAAAIVPGSEVMLPGVALNPTRLGFVEVLRRMGCELDTTETGTVGAEAVGTIVVRSQTGLTAATITAQEVPSLVDEVPLLAVVACAARGRTRFEGVGELRVKETDRLDAIGRQLMAMGVVTRLGDDWLEVDGPVRLRACPLDSLGDHRLAMAWAVAALIASGPVEIAGFDAVTVSYPRFAADLATLAQSTER